MESMLSGADQVREVTLPHDASVEHPRNPQEPNGSGNGFFREENCYYTKEFTVDAEDQNKEVWIEFEGVYQNAFVYINHAFAGKHPYGYGNFYINATPYLNFGGKNEIKVLVRNGVPSGRWYTGGGIYRDVNLMIGDRLHLVPDQVHVSTPEIEEDLAVVLVDSGIAYHGIGVRDIELRTVILDPDGLQAAEDIKKITCLESTEQNYVQRLYVSDPKLWNTDTPGCTAIVPRSWRMDR